MSAGHIPDESSNCERTKLRGVHNPRGRSWEWARGSGKGARDTGYLEFVGGSPAIGREVLEEGDEPEEAGVPVAQ